MRAERLRESLLGAAGFAVVVALWWLVADTAFAETGVVPSPLDLARQLGADGPGYYLRQIGVTLASAGTGFAYGVALAWALATIVMLLPRSLAAVSQLALFIECAPAAALGPVVLAVVGGRTPSIFLASIAVLFTTLIGTLLGVGAARRAELDVVRVYGGNRWDLFRKVRVVAALPAAFTALKIAVPGAILGAIIGEFLGGVDSGVGTALAAAQRSIQVERTWILGLSAALVTSLGYLLLGVLARTVLPWAPAARSAR